MAGKNIHLDTEITELTSTELRQTIENNKDVKEFNIYISSFGGGVEPGLSIKNYLRGLEGKTINTFIMSHADSIASIIFLGAKKENRHVVPSSKFFMHSPRFMGIDEVVTMEVLDQMKKSLKFDNERLLSIYDKEFTNLSREELDEKMKAETDLTPQDLVDFGVIDKKNILPEFKIAAINKNEKKMLDLFKSKNKNEEKQKINHLVLNDGENEIHVAYTGDNIVKDSQIQGFGDVEAITGEFTLKDGTVLVIEEDKVLEVRAPEEVEETEEESESIDLETITAAINKAIVDTVAPLQEQIQNISDEFASLKTTASKGKPSKAIELNNTTSKAVSVNDIQTQIRLNKTKKQIANYNNKRNTN